MLCDDGTMPIASALKENRVLTTLYLSNKYMRNILIIGYNKIEELGCISIAEMLKINTTLTRLRISNIMNNAYYLDHNSIKKGGAEAIKEALMRNRKLATINIGIMSIFHYPV